MKDLHTFYSHQIEGYQAKLEIVKKTLFASSMLRLAIFISALVGVYVAFESPKVILLIVSATIVLFLFLVLRHANLQYKADKLQALISINKTEIEVLNRNFHQLPDGREFKDPKHHFSQDLDLFGKGSFYQYINRTALQQGSTTLAGLLTENATEAILQKQSAIAELSQMSTWRQEFLAVANLVKTEVGSKTIIHWIKEYQVFVPKAMKYLPTVFSFLSLGVGTLYFLDVITGWTPLLWIFIGLGITGFYVKKINLLSEATGKAQSTFQQYQKLVMEIENTPFEAVPLNQKKELIVRGKEKASLVLKKFSGILNALDQRNNMIFGFFGNALLLWDLRQCYKLERWIQEYGQEVEEWFMVIAFFDAYISLGNFAFNHPSYTFPILSKNDTILKAHEASHPLLDPKKSVSNSLEITKEQFFIITGANMAGKSTFLRTVSLQIVMANVGLPVCATSVTYHPIKLITSMRTTDSLTDDESYFFSELKRLKFIVDEIKKDRYFIVLDEILKGTNSTDKAIGSKKFVGKLVDSNSTGIIATHDLSLCELEKELPAVKNHYFDAEIIHNELHFDYKIKEGICKNMNASFLLKKMEIVD